MNNETDRLLKAIHELAAEAMKTVDEIEVVSENERQMRRIETNLLAIELLVERSQR